MLGTIVGAAVVASVVKSIVDDGKQNSTRNNSEYVYNNIDLTKGIFKSDNNNRDINNNAAQQNTEVIKEIYYCDYCGCAIDNIFESCKHCGAPYTKRKTIEKQNVIQTNEQKAENNIGQNHFYGINQTDNLPSYGKAKIPISISAGTTDNVMKVRQKLLNAGFTNIKCNPLNDLMAGGVHQPGEVSQIFIEGKEISSSFKRKYDTNVPIIILFHDYIK